MREEVGTVLYVFLGWLLGLLTAPIADRINKHCQRREIERGILTELKELEVKLVGVVYLVAYRSGTITRELVTWLQTHIEEYAGVHPSDEAVGTINRLSVLSDEELAANLSHLALRGYGRGLTLKKHQTPLLDSKVNSLIVFNEGFQNRVLEIKGQINTLNEEVDLARFYLEKTFDSLSEENHQTVSQNLDDCYKQISAMARRIVDHISKLESV